MRNANQQLASAIRKVAGAVRSTIDEHHGAWTIDADDLVKVLLAIAKQIDSPNRVAPAEACPNCGERDADRLIWQEDHETVRCAGCGTIYAPGGGEG